MNFFKHAGLNTVCVSAHCPNLTRCFKEGQATFIILGDVCTRDCLFCAVKKNKEPLALDNDEPQRIAAAARRLGLKYVVITSVTRDDLPDGGAGHFVKTVNILRKNLAGAKIELLIPDFKNKEGALELVVDCVPDVLGHNLETVPALYARVRPQADYRYSLKILEKIKNLNQKIFTKSSLILGMGEKEKEVIAVLEDLRKANCDILTLGQYLSPSDKHHSVKEFVGEDQFDYYRSVALALGFKAVLSGPLVRSSYKAEETYYNCLRMS
ncbi:MAG: lipoyl synthase, partial [Candidatus Omnitrophica bacterium]|nr:lipoyl synthase [Candidatus Omnitrophota bacterium]